MIGNTPAITNVPVCKLANKFLHYVSGSLINVSHEHKKRCKKISDGIGNLMFFIHYGFVYFFQTK